jgi:ribonuclease HII
MGPLAGPVVAAAVVLQPGLRLRGLRDSKQLSRPERERLALEVRRSASSAAIGVVSPREIDRINIYQAGLLAMKRAIAKLVPPPDLLLIDARRLAKLDIPQRSIVKGDAKVGSIAAASIVAKVERDKRMVSLARRYPGYGFEHHKGYATEDHLRALAERGPTPIHRRSFAPVRQVAEPPPARQGDLF